MSEEPSGMGRVLAVFRRGGERSSFDARNTWQVAVGAVLMPLGLVIILVAWYGAAHARHVQQQIPYLVSGSFIGLGLMIVGALLYWAHWLYRVYDQADLHHAEMLQAQEEQTRALVEALSQSTHNGRRASVTAGAGFVATAGGSNFHLPDCPVVSRSRRSVRPVTARAAKSMQPCRICDPLQSPATTGA